MRVWYEARKQRGNALALRIRPSTSALSGGALAYDCARTRTCQRYLFCSWSGMRHSVRGRATAHAARRTFTCRLSARRPRNQSRAFVAPSWVEDWRHSARHTRATWADGRAGARLLGRSPHPYKGRGAWGSRGGREVEGRGREGERRESGGRAEVERR